MDGHDENGEQAGCEGSLVSKAGQGDYDHSCCSVDWIGEPPTPAECQFLSHLQWQSQVAFTIEVLGGLRNSGQEVIFCEMRSNDGLGSSASGMSTPYTSLDRSVICRYWCDIVRGGSLRSRGGDACSDPPDGVSPDWNSDDASGLGSWEIRFIIRRRGQLLSEPSSGRRECRKRNGIEKAKRSAARSRRFELSDAHEDTQITGLNLMEVNNSSCQRIRCRHEWPMRQAPSSQSRRFPIQQHNAFRAVFGWNFRILS